MLVNECLPCKHFKVVSSLKLEHASHSPLLENPGTRVTQNGLSASVLKKKLNKGIVKKKKKVKCEAVETVQGDRRTELPS